MVKIFLFIKLLTFNFIYVIFVKYSGGVIMNTEFNMNYRVNLGNMHINLNGYLDEPGAEQVIDTIKEIHFGEGRIFIDTQNLHGISIIASDNFKKSFNNLSINNNNLYIKGKNGMDLVPKGGRLIILKDKKELKAQEHKEHSCSGSGNCNCKVPCKVCKCALKRKEQAEQVAS